ncbi:aquaporin 12 [Pimephales promelas]|uniref:aquaporin 12 n=1 Tax=Pimephales promelas TaxID=90988 RepID=UPI0019559698|nr:aquaporin 12 [Pimephales promelas]KAG1925492.1 aquaporin [Pimephales promelas]
MSGLNASLGYFLTIVGVSAVGRVILSRSRLRWTFLTEFIAAFALAACRLEVDTIAEVGQWAGALGPDVAITMLFLSITIHGVVMQGVSGNPSVTLMGVLQRDVGAVAGVLSVAAQLLGAYLALVVAGKYWEMELTDMHMIKNLMMSECSTSLRVSTLQGALAEALGAVTFHLVYLVLKSRSQLLRIPLLALLLTFIAYAGNNYTSGYVNPSLAYALTFPCPGHSFLAYSLVYWLGPLIGMSLALFLYLGNIPLLFSRNLLYSKKARFRVPKGKTSED